jgi:IDEAL domain
MTKLLCKVCGNDKFQLLNENEALCKCGLRLTNLGEDHSKIGKERFDLDYKRQASVITKVILLKRSIDESLDKRDKEAFYKLSSKLKVYQQYFQTKMNNL